MMKGRSIVCMPLTTWNSNFPNTVVNMMTLLSKENKILFVDYQFTYKDLISSWRKPSIKRILGLEERLQKVTTSIGSEVYVLTPPPVLPVSWIKDYASYKFFLNLNAGIIKGSIQRAMKELGIESPVVINGYNAFYGLPLAGEFNEMLNIYYCYDEIKGDQWYSLHGARIEEEYMKKADLVIATSQALHDSKCGINQNCYVVKNGVDFEPFNKVADIPKEGSLKVVGYTGSIDERFDIDTVTFLVEQMPYARFDFVGRITNEEARRSLEVFPNVRLYGGRKPEEVPMFLPAMNVCIIPYLRNEVTKGVYPLKINEYLAAGKPVVMTDFASLTEFNSIVRIASSKSEFLKFLREEIENNSEEKKKARIEVARKNSWENRVEELSEVIEKFLVAKPVLSA